MASEVTVIENIPVELNLGDRTPVIGRATATKDLDSGEITLELTLNFQHSVKLEQLVEMLELKSLGFAGIRRLQHEKDNPSTRGILSGPIFGTGLVKDSKDYVRTPGDRAERREQGVAGSYKHVITDDGNLVSNETFVGMIENLGDAYEMAEEMYGMIWYLANMSPRAWDDTVPTERVARAMQNYKEGLAAAKANKNKQMPGED